MTRVMSATEVARNFSEVLDLVAAGETIEITRGKQVLGVISPKLESPWFELKKQLALFQKQNPVPAVTDKELIAALDEEVANYRYSDLGTAQDREAN